MTAPIHAGVVAAPGPDGWRGVLILGPSGAGKSDLALRLMGAGFRLVADDYAHVWASGDGVFATAPEAIAGRIEARGLGIVSVSALPLTRLRLAVRCLDRSPERLPEPAFETVAGVALPRLDLDPRPASAVALVAGALARL